MGWANNDENSKTNLNTHLKSIDCNDSTHLENKHIAMSCCDNTLRCITLDPENQIKTKD